jgi:predicted aminopeptidase
MSRYRTLKPLAFLPLLLALALSACSDYAYYRQCAEGQIDLLSRRRAISDLLADPATSASLKERLAQVLEIRNFASRELLLPDNESYRCYADLDRSSVVWNVVAAPEFALDPLRWCFPVAGCVPYRGYYHEGGAEAFAAGLREAGHDVYVYGVPAYSTLGWFDDPILNTFIDRSDRDLAGLIFHELSHQKIYLKGDAEFNEAFATTVEVEGVELWLQAHGSAEDLAAQRLARSRQDEFLELVAVTRTRLADLYRQPLSAAEKRIGKAAILDGLRADYRRLKENWGGYAGYDRWFSGELNNARFVSVSTYRRLVPAFQVLLRENGGDWQRFFRAVEELAALPAAERRTRLEGLLALPGAAGGGG